MKKLERNKKRMEEFLNKNQRNKELAEVKTFSVQFPTEELKDNIVISTNARDERSEEQIIKQAFRFHSEGKIKDAAKCYQDFLDQGFIDPRVFSNYGMICQEEGKNKKAKKLFEKSIELFPNCSQSYLNLGNLLNVLGKPKQAELLTRKAIEIKPNFALAFSNLGIILQDQYKLKEAELSFRKAILIEPDFALAYFQLAKSLKEQGKLVEAEINLLKAIKIQPDIDEYYSSLGDIYHNRKDLKKAEIYLKKTISINPSNAINHYNLGVILKDQGKLQEAEFHIAESNRIDKYFSKPYYVLSSLSSSINNELFLFNLFSDDITKNQSKEARIDMFFARANILHNKKKYKESAKYLILANNLKLKIYPSNFSNYIKKSNQMEIESRQMILKKSKGDNKKQYIFIVGMPRSGSTLAESIISMNNEVYDLGEVNILEEAFLESKSKSLKDEISLNEIYKDKTIKISNGFNITTNKWLFNYQYAGIIANEFPTGKIVHCTRDPLDNILSIYRANFHNGNNFSSSLFDIANVYLDHVRILNKYKLRFPGKIYELNYDSLVKNSNREIRSLISWLGWKWSDKYLSPHKNKRSVLTASSIQVRSPINNKSVGGWKNYQEMLSPVIEMITNQKDLISK